MVNLIARRTHARFFHRDIIRIRRVAFVLAVAVTASKSRAAEPLFGAPFLSFYVGNPSSVAIGDLDGDGTPDLALSNDYGVSVLLAKGDGTFRVKNDYTTGVFAVSVAIGDLSGDGKMDLAQLCR